MTKRSELLNNLISLSAEKLKEWAQPNSKEYIHLLRELIIQGMVSLLEPIIKIRVRQQDRDNAVKLFPECEKEFSEIMKRETERDYSCKLQLDTKNLENEC